MPHIWCKYRNTSDYESLENESMSVDGRVSQAPKRTKIGGKISFFYKLLLLLNPVLFFLKNSKNYSKINTKFFINFDQKIEENGVLQ